MNRDNTDNIYSILKENKPVFIYLINSITLDGIIKHVGDDYIRIKMNGKNFIVLKDKITHILLQ